MHLNKPSWPHSGAKILFNYRHRNEAKKAYQDAHKRIFKSVAIIQVIYAVARKLKGSHKVNLFKIFTSMDLQNGSFLKPFNKLTVRVLSDI